MSLGQWGNIKNYKHIEKGDVIYVREYQKYKFIFYN